MYRLQYKKTQRYTEKYKFTMYKHAVSHNQPDKQPFLSGSLAYHCKNMSMT